MTRPALSAVAQGVWMVVLWVLLWGEVSAANIVSGLLVSVALLSLLPLRQGERGAVRLRPLQAIWFGLFFVYKLVQSNLLVAWEIVTPRDRIHAGVVAVPMADYGDGLVTLVANCITLTPGTLTLEVRRDPTTLYVHVLHLHDVEAVRRDVITLQRLAVRAFGTDEALARFRAEHAEVAS